MKEFLKPRFIGTRFDEHTLPVEVARDLAAYEELVTELAKHLYLTRHAGRKRVPKGFEQSFSLHVARVEPGSAVPVLAVVAPEALALAGGYGDYFEEARDMVSDCVRAKAQGKPLPVEFPKGLLAYFNVFGRSLRAGESLELPCRDGAAELTPENRKALVLDVEKVYEREVEVGGTVPTIAFRSGTFELRRPDGATVNVPMPVAFTESIRQSGGRDRTLVQVRGVGVFDASDTLSRISETHHIEVIPNHALASQLESLALLEDGWFDGVGKAPHKEQFAELSDKLVDSFPEDIPFPHIGPTPEGGLFLEWVFGDWRVSAEFLLPGDSCEMQAANTRTHAVQDADFRLAEAGSLASIYEFVKSHR